MRPPLRTRALVGLIAAYALALQTILLTFGGAVAGGGASAFASVPICAYGGDGPAGPPPDGHRQGCLAACLAGCSGGLLAVLPPAQMVPVPHALKVPDGVTAAATAHARVIGQYRSRAPPLA